MKEPLTRGEPRYARLWIALLLGGVFALAVGLSAAQAETLPPAPASSDSGTASVDVSAPPIRTHTNVESTRASDSPFWVPCAECHVLHDAPSTNLLRADGASVCANCHDLAGIHGDPATQEAAGMSGAPNDCVSCHPHGTGFMPVVESLVLDLSSSGYDDLDGDGVLSPGDRVHYQIDYANPGPEDMSGVTLHVQTDAPYTATGEEISDAGVLTGSAIEWNLGDLAVGSSGSVSCAVVLQDDATFAAMQSTTTTASSSSSGTDGGTGSTTTATTGLAAPSTTDTLAADDDPVSTTDTTVASGDLVSTTDTTASPDPGPSATDTTGPTTDTTSETVDTTSDSVDPSGPDTTSRTVPSDSGTVAEGAIEVVATATLAVENLPAVSSSVSVWVMAGDAGGTTTSSPTPSDTTSSTEAAPTTETATTTTESTTPSSPAVDTVVVNTAYLAADSRETLSASARVPLMVPGVSAPAPSAALAPDGADAYPAALTLGQESTGYDDLDGSGDVSPGDTVRYRINYANPGAGEVTGVMLRVQLDASHVASLVAVSDGGASDGGAIRWDIGTLASGGEGHVTYDAVVAYQVVRPGWVFPVQGPNDFVDSFGAPRYAGEYHLHAGCDIMCAGGTPLVAVVDGVVASANRVDSGLGGLTVWLRGDDGNSYYYAHLSSIREGIDEGARVVAGQVLGAAGNTGDAGGGPMHLHFEIYVGGGPAVDPYLVLKGLAEISDIPIVDLSVTTTTTTTIGPTTSSTTDTTSQPTDTSTETTASDSGATSTSEAPPTTVPPPSGTTTTTAEASQLDTNTTVLPPSTDTTATTAQPPAASTTTTSDSAAVPMAAGAFVALPGGILLGWVRRRLFPRTKRRR